LFSFLSHSPVSPNPNPLHYDEEEALRSPPTHCTTTKKKHPPHHSSTSIPHHSTIGSAPFDHRTHAVDPHTARAMEPSISTDQNQSTKKKKKKKKRAQLNYQKKKKGTKPPKSLDESRIWRASAESTSSFTGVDPSTECHPSSIHGRSGLIVDP
jgi:hypothetical protein